MSRIEAERCAAPSNCRLTSMSCRTAEWLREIWPRGAIVPNAKGRLLVEQEHDIFWCKVIWHEHDIGKRIASLPRRMKGECTRMGIALLALQPVCAIQALLAPHQADAKEAAGSKWMMVFDWLAEAVVFVQLGVGVMLLTWVSVCAMLLQLTWVFVQLGVMLLQLTWVFVCAMLLQLTWVFVQLRVGVMLLQLTWVFVQQGVLLLHLASVAFVQL